MYSFQYKLILGQVTLSVFSLSSSFTLILFSISPYLLFPHSPNLPLSRWQLSEILLSALIFSWKSVGSRGPLAAAQGFVGDGEHCRRMGGEPRRREEKRGGLGRQGMRFTQGEIKEGRGVGK